MDGRWREGRLIDVLMSTLTDGWLAGELHDWAGDDRCFMFVSLYVCESQSESFFLCMFDS